MAKAAPSTALATRAAAPKGTLARIAAGIARAVRPKAAIDMRDPVWQSVLTNGGFGGTPFLPSEAGITVTPDIAMTISTVYGCVRVISETIAMLPLRLFERDGKRHSVAEGHPVDDLLFYEPNRWQTPYEFKQFIAASQCLRGNGFAYILRGRGGAPLEIQPLAPQRMAIRQLTDLTAQYQYTHYEGKYEEFTSGDGQIMHFRTLVTDGVRGLSPIAAARNGLGLVLQQENHASKLFTQGALPMGVLKAQRALTPEAVKLLRMQFDETFSGVANSHRTIVLEEGMDWSKISLNAEETQFLQSRKFSRTEIAMFFGVPPHMIGDVEKATSWGSGIEQQGIGFLVYTMQPWLNRQCETLAKMLLTREERRRFYIQFDTDALTRGDLQSRTQSIINLTNNGLLTRNEGRAMLNWSATDEAGADTLTVSTNTVYLDSPQVREGINRTAQELSTKLPPKNQPAKD